MQRRQFIRNTVAGGLGLALAHPRDLFAVTSTPTTTLQAQPGPVLLKGKADDLKLNAADTAVLKFLSAFSDRLLFTGGCVAGKSAQGGFRVTHILARIASMDKYQAFTAQRGAITGNGMCIGNTICFNYQLGTFELEALLPAAFSQRLADIKAGLRLDGSEMVYAHEALLYEPATRTLTDSFRAMAGQTGALKRIVTPDGYPDLFPGSLDATAYRLLASSRDQTDLNTLTGSPVKNADMATEVAAAFLQNLSYNSQVNATATLVQQCGNRLVRTAIQAVLGCDSQRVAGNFGRLRAKVSTDITDGSIWHALFQGSEKPVDGRPKAGALAVSGDNELAKYLTMQEFQKVALVKSNAAFKNYV